MLLIYTFIGSLAALAIGAFAVAWPVRWRRRR